MAVVIDEMVTEMAQDPGRSAALGASDGSGEGEGGGRAEPDMDRFDQEMARRIHRSIRLWAD